MEEYEVKFLDIDPVDIEKKVIAAGGHRAFDRMFRRVVFDYPDLRLDKDGAWVRVRDEGEKVVLSFKKRILSSTQDGNDEGMIEHEVEVSDFDTALEIMRSIGLSDKFFIENRRVQFMLDGVEIDIEYWPMLPPYIEIEGSSWKDVDATIAKLELNPNDKKIYSTTQIYKHYGIRDKDYSHLTFENPRKR